MKKQATILAVDDTEINVDILVGILKRYDVIPATNGLDALEIAKNEDIDLILLDIMMPDMDGYEVCRTLKNDETTKGIPIIFITVKTTENDIKEGFKIGAADYVTKPFNPIELIARVDTHLKLRECQVNIEQMVKNELEKQKLEWQTLAKRSEQKAISKTLTQLSSHLKTPLLELASINKNSKTEELKDSFLEQGQKIDTISKTINEFESFHKPSTEKTHFLLNTTITKACNIISPTLNQCNIKLTINTEDNPKVFGNEFACGQLILELLNDSKDALSDKAIDDKEIKIDIKAEADRPTIYITNNSKEEIFSKIFIDDSATIETNKDRVKIVF